MEFYKYDNLMSLDSSTYNWNCRVRAQAVWNAKKKDSVDIWGTNMILIDDCNNRIHAFASAKYCEVIHKQITEGGIYIISNFKVKDFVGDEPNRPVRCEKHIFFTAKSKVTKDEEGWLQIEKYAFDLFHMREIEKLANDNRFLIDMVGIVENRRDIISSTKNDVETKRFKFNLSDGRDTVKVTLFGDFGIECHEALQKFGDEPVVVVLCFAKVNRYEGKCNLTNYPATRMYINPEHYSVDIVKNKHAAMIALEIESVEEESKVEDLTVEQIKALNADYLEKIVSCEVTVKRLEENLSWYSNTCLKCKVEVDREGKSFRCPTCKRLIPYPERKFEVCTLCSDESGAIAIIFQDAEVFKLIGKTVYDIQATYPKDMKDEPFPVILRNLLNRKYTVSLFLEKDNISKGSAIYKAVEVYPYIEPAGDHISTEQEYMDAEPTSITCGRPNGETSDEMATTAHSCNKSRARKNVEPIPYEEEQITPKQIKNQRYTRNKKTN